MAFSKDNENILPSATGQKREQVYIFFYCFQDLLIAFIDGLMPKQQLKI
jgi:hypothetical protein